MLSSDKNVESLASLIETMKDYVGLQKEYLKLDVVDKSVRLISAAILGVVLLILLVAVLFYLSFAFVYWIEPHTGTAWAFAIVALLFLLLLLTVYAKRKPWIEQPLLHFLTQILLN